MIDAVSVIRDWLIDADYNVQYKIQADQWRDSGNKNSEYIVLFASGGTVEGSLQQNPSIRLFIAGKEGAASRGVGSVMETVLSIIEYTKNTVEFGGLAMIQPITMPSGTGLTGSQRPFVELNLTTIIK